MADASQIAMISRSIRGTVKQKEIRSLTVPACGMIFLLRFKKRKRRLWAGFRLQGRQLNGNPDVSS
jgi:hypothetical protein